MALKSRSQKRGGALFCGFSSTPVGSQVYKHTKSLVLNCRMSSFLLSILALFFTECAHRHSVQGVSRSNRPYYLHGTWHYPQNYYDYDEVGLASWYGPGFHLALKAQGEPYNQHGMTAAHKTLPLPTIVRVTNPANGKSVVVLVDDRGPYKYKNRIIDLSMSAAKVLDLHRKGVSKVRVESLPRESHEFSMYLKKYGTKDRYGNRRTWEEVYRQEIGWRSGLAQLSPLPHSERHAHARAHQHVKASFAQKQATSSSSSSQKSTRPKNSIHQYLRSRS